MKKFTAICTVSIENGEMLIFTSFSNDNKKKVIGAMKGHLFIFNLLAEMDKTSKIESLFINDNIEHDSIMYTIDEFNQLIKQTL